MQKILLCILVTLLFTNSHAQDNKFNFGFKAEISIFSIEAINYMGKYETETSSEPNLYAVLNPIFSESLSLLILPGYAFGPDLLDGPELGIHLKYCLTNLPVFFTGGLNSRLISSSDHGNSLNEGIDSKIIYWIAGGIGYSLSDNFNIDIIYQYTLNNEVGRRSAYYSNSGIPTRITGINKITSVIKFGMTAYF